ncbi:MAG TPA: amino acid adenylation domain-containing protein, partial [Gaiellales bacterium]|nr:amino acid adenylation domain-containing protein [Gaiellales bacterium]
MLVFNWDAVEELFPAGLLDAMFQAFCDLLGQLAQEESAWESAVGARVPRADLELQAAANATEAPVPVGLLHTRIGERARLEPQRVAVIAGEREVCYGELWNLAQLLGGRLRAQGAEPNRLVAVVMEKGWEQVAAVLGVLVSGAAYLPIDPDLPRERIWTLLALGEVRLVLTQPWIDERLQWPEQAIRLRVEAKDLAAAAAPQLEAVQGPGDLAYVIFTSGSTGQPKGVMIDHRSALNTVIDVNERFGVAPSDRVLALSSLSFDLSVYDIFGLLTAGGALIVPEPWALREPSRWRELMERHGATLWNSVPALLEMYVESMRELRSAAPLRLVLLSGDWIPVRLPERVRRLWPGVEVISLGGATEASIWSILYPIGEVDPHWPSIPYGRAMANQRFYVLDERREPRPVWVPGSLYIGGSGLAVGYWRDAQKTAASFTVHPRTGERLYRTGDEGRYLPSGEIELLGREDFQVKVQGYRIELGEIETALEQHPAVRAAVVVAAGDSRTNRRLVAYVVPEETMEAKPEELRARLAEILPSYMLPSSWMMLESLPLTPNGKVDRQALPAPGAP